MVAGLETFAKVRALHDRTDSPGEKANAAGRMEALAAAAGMTVAEAVSKLDAPTEPVKPAPSFSDIFDTPFFRQAKAEADRERAEKWRKVLTEYGSEDAVFAPCEWETALERACNPFVVRKRTTGWCMGSLWGWNYVTSVDDPPPQIVDAIKSAYPMPETVRQAWAEFKFWDKLGRDREARGAGCGDHPDWVCFRVQLVERLLNTLPAIGLADLRARLSWMDWLNDMETAPDPKEERVRLATLRADIERMAVRIGDEAAPVQSGQGDTGQPVPRPDTGTSLSPVQSGHPRRTNAEKRRDVLAMLNLGDSQTASLADREIARRAGVSPQTVGNIRRRSNRKR